jgi:hypothetical protein
MIDGLLEMQRALEFIFDHTIWMFLPLRCYEGKLGWASQT